MAQTCSQVCEQSVSLRGILAYCLTASTAMHPSQQDPCDCPVLMLVMLSGISLPRAICGSL